jgi:cell division protein FtsZ
MKTLLDAAILQKGLPEDAKVLTPEIPDDKELREIIDGLKLSIKVFGCGGGGSNTITRLMDTGVVGAELIACNTDARHLLSAHSHKKILLGKRLTKGLGAGGLPQMGEQSAREAEEELKKALQNAHIVFIACGLGGGTGTGSAPIVAQLAKQTGAMVIAFATKPFKGEGRQRMEEAEMGLSRLTAVADTVVVISNDKLLEMAPKLPLDKAFLVLDELLMDAIKSIIELVTKPGLVNLDYNDLKTIIDGGGVSVMGLGECDTPGGNRVDEAVGEVLKCPLLEFDIRNATGVLVKITGGPDMTLAEAERVAEIILSKVDPATRLIWGASVEPDMESAVKVMLVVTGVTSKHIMGRTDRRGLQPVGRPAPGLDLVR